MLIFGVLNTKTCFKKLEIENASVWHLNASVWAFKRPHLMVMKSTPGPPRKSIFWNLSAKQFQLSCYCNVKIVPSNFPIFAAY